MYPLRFSIHHVPQKEKSHHRHSSKLLLVKPQGLCRGEFYYSPATDSASIAGYDRARPSVSLARPLSRYRFSIHRGLRLPSDRPSLGSFRATPLPIQHPSRVTTLGERYLHRMRPSPRYRFSIHRGLRRPTEEPCPPWSYGPLPIQHPSRVTTGPSTLLYFQGPTDCFARGSCNVLIFATRDGD